MCHDCAFGAGAPAFSPFKFHSGPYLFPIPTIKAGDRGHRFSLYHQQHLVYLQLHLSLLTSALALTEINRKEPLSLIKAGIKFLLFPSSLELLLSALQHYSILQAGAEVTPSARFHGSENGGG